MTTTHLPYITVFITGACVLILEVAAVRLLTPYYGSSLYVFSSVLSIILAALSLGYWYGGQRADHRHSLKDLAAIITVSGLSVLILLAIAEMTLSWAAIHFSVSLGPLLFAGLFFFFPALLLGTVSPYIVRLQAEHSNPDHSGRVAGSIFFWGTVGSILGSIVTGFWLLPSLGVVRTIAAAGLVLTLLGVLLPPIHGYSYRLRRILWPILVAIILSWWVVTFDHEMKQPYVYRSEGLYSSLSVIDGERAGRPIRLLKRDANFSSGIYLDNPDEFVFVYTQAADLYPTLVPNATSFLMLGGGAYTIPTILHQRHPTLTIDVVEFEPALFSIAQTYFGLPDSPRIVNHTLDARRFLATTEASYDVIYGDLFSTNHAAPFHLSSYEFYSLVASRLASDGVFMMNIIARPHAPRPSLFGSTIKTLQAVFPTVVAYGLQGDTGAEQNILVVARKDTKSIDLANETIQWYNNELVSLDQFEINLAALDTTKELLLTDDRAPVDYLKSKES